MIDLSILVCSVHTRYDTFLPKIQKQLFGQYELLSESDKQRVEILVLVDNKKTVVGAKRNHMVIMAQGKYVQFVDDDDRVSPDFLHELLKAAESDADCIVFTADVSLNGEPPKPCYYSKDNGRDFNKPDTYFRIPNHICCVKKSLAMKVPFPNLACGEDSAYAVSLLPHLKTQHRIDKTLYFYNFNSATTETQMTQQEAEEPKSMEPIVDVIILSNGNSRAAQFMTQNAIDSCIYGANGLPVNVIVLEQQDCKYSQASTVKMEGKFHYNKFANEGAALGKAKWIMIANNDLKFQDGWLHALLGAGHSLVSPVDPGNLAQMHIGNGNEIGEIVGCHLSGWCFMIWRKLWEQIGGFDECVDFWCSDDVVIEQVKAKKILPMAVGTSRVRHRISASHSSLTSEDLDRMKWGNVKIFNDKYKKKKFANDPRYLRYCQRINEKP